MTLVAFAATTGLPAGTVATSAQAAEVGIASSDQVGALRWLPGSGVVHQVYVAPVWRRQRVASTLMVAAERIRYVHGWPPLHGGEARTDLGHAMLEAVPAHWASRVLPRRSALPPMTPGEARPPRPSTPTDPRPADGGWVRADPPG